MADRDLKFISLGTRVIAISGSDANDAGFLPGRLYRFVMSGLDGATACCAWGSGAATAADAGSDFVITAGSGPIEMRAPGTTLHAIQSGVGGNLFASLIDEGP